MTNPLAPSPPVDYATKAEDWLGNLNYGLSTRLYFAAATAQLGILAQLTCIANALEEANRQ